MTERGDSRITNSGARHRKPDEPDDEPGSGVVAAAERLPRRERGDGIRVATLAVLTVDTLIVILLAAFLVTVVQSQRETNECYQHQVDQLVRYLNSATEAARQDRQAQRELLLSIVEPGESERPAIDRYIAQLDSADRTRRTNPVPTQRCIR